MAEVFLSYKSERRNAAEHLATILDHYGYSTWFDYKLIKGDDFALQIDRKVREAKALVVLWCSLSVGSRWVAEEVDLAHELGILIPLKIEVCTLPIGFRRQDYIDLSSWDGAPRSYQLDPLLDALEQRIGRPPRPDQKKLREYEQIWRRFGAQPLNVFALGPPIAAIEAEEKKRRGGKTSRTPPSDRVNPSGPENEPQRLEERTRRDEETEAQGETEKDTRGQEPTFVRVMTGMQEVPGRITSTPAIAEQEEKQAGARTRDQPPDFRPGWSASPRTIIIAGVLAIALAGGLGISFWSKPPLLQEPSPPPAPVPVVPETPPAIDSTTVKEQPLSRDHELALKPGVSFKECSSCPDMIVAPAGSFVMGSPDSEPRRVSDEGPQHAVTVERAFAVAKFAITFDEWDACTADGGCNGYRPEDHAWGRGRRPVLYVNWSDAKAYVTWLSHKTGKIYRLLSEAEREYVTRAGTTTPFWLGMSISLEQANFGGANVYSSSFSGFRRQTVPVDAFQPNHWGLYQVHGNVREWTEDCYNSSYREAPADGSPWSRGDCNHRVLRNGSWVNMPALLRSAFRGTIGNNDIRSDTIGFRVARTLTAAQ